MGWEIPVSILGDELRQLMSRLSPGLLKYSSYVVILFKLVQLENLFQI